MTIRFLCRECGAKMRVGDGNEGRKVRCPVCGANMHVPQESESLVQAVAPAARTAATEPTPADLGAAAAVPAAESPSASPPSPQPLPAAPALPVNDSSAQEPSLPPSAPLEPAVVLAASGLAQALQPRKKKHRPHAREKKKTDGGVQEDSRIVQTPATPSAPSAGGTTPGAGITPASAPEPVISAAVPPSPEPDIPSAAIVPSGAVALPASAPVVAPASPADADPVSNSDDSEVSTQDTALLLPPAPLFLAESLPATDAQESTPSIVLGEPVVIASQVDVAPAAMVFDLPAEPACPASSTVAPPAEPCSTLEQAAPAPLETSLPLVQASAPAVSPLPLPAAEPPAAVPAPAAPAPLIRRQLIKKIQPVALGECQNCDPEPASSPGTAIPADWLRGLWWVMVGVGCLAIAGSVYVSAFWFAGGLASGRAALGGPVLVGGLVGGAILLWEAYLLQLRSHSTE